MRRILPILFLISSSSASAYQFQPQWVKTGGPIGGLGYNVRIHPTNKNIMYVTDAWSGMNKSTDGGQTWFASNSGITIRLGPSNDAIPIFSLAIDEQNPDVVWAGTQGLRGIFKSTDGGNSWTKKDSGITVNEGLTIRNFETHPPNSNIVFAAGELSVGVQGIEFDKVMGVLYKTTNGGDSWTKILQDSSLFRWMCINHSNPQNMFVFSGIFDREALNTVGKGNLKSTDSGQTWFPINQGLQGSLFVGGMGMHPTSALTFIVGTGNYTELNRGVYGGVFRTTDGGDSWTSVLGPRAPQSPGNPDNSFTAIAYSVSNPNIVYAANAVAFYRSADGGTNWTRYAGAGGANYGPPGVRAGVPIEITVDRDDPNVVFVNNYGGGVFKSTDGAQTWQVLGKGYTGADIHKVAVSPQNRNVVLVNGRSGPFKSSNAGDDWTGIAYGEASGPAEWYSAALHPTNQSVLLLSDEHDGLIFRSTDGGGSWTRVFDHPSANPSSPSTRQGAKQLLFAPSNPQIVYAGFAAEGFFSDPSLPVPQSFGIYKAVDGGLLQQSWVAKNSGLESTNLNIVAMAVSQADSSLVYIGVRGSGIYKTTNGADLWVNVTNNLSSTNVFAIGISSSNSNLVYAGTSDNGIFKSTDGGSSWTQSLSGSPVNQDYPSKVILSLAVHPKNDSIAFVADWRSGMYRTIDAGNSWQQINTGLSTRAVQSLAISADGLYLYAGTKGEGVFRLQTAAVAPPVTPVLTSPANGAINQQLIVTLSWSPVDGADNYRVQLATNQNFSPTLMDDSTLTTPSRTMSSLILNATYYWRVSAKNLGGTSNFSSTFSFKTIVATSVEIIDNAIPTEFELSQNYPNPFNPSTTIEISLPKQTFVKLVIYNTLGMETEVLLSEHLPAGRYRVQWMPPHASGVYFYQLRTEDFTKTRKLLFLR